MRQIGFSLLLAAAVGLSACSFGRFGELQRNLSELENLGAFHGHIECDGCAGGRRIVVALYEGEDGWRVDNYAVAADDGFFLVRVHRGRKYRVVAFEDRNVNGAFDRGEPVAIGSGVEEISQNDRPKGLNLRLGASDRVDVALVRALSSLANAEQLSLPISFGNQANLDDPQFDPALGGLGLWRAADFFTQIGGGVYLLSPFERGKVPVFFVHGAGGTPREFAYLISGLDTAKFQPIVFQYPSGLRLSASAEMLTRLTQALQKQYGFTQYAIVAHSMGGLVAMASLREHGAAEAQGKRVLVTLATPWGGHEAAAWGVKYAPTAIPSWIDVEPGSEFLSGLFEVPSSGPGFSHFLLFAFGGQNGDGVVRLGSQLRPLAQMRAVKVVGFDESHASILESPGARSYVYTALQQEF